MPGGIIVQQVTLHFLSLPNSVFSRARRKEARQ